MKAALQWFVAVLLCTPAAAPAAEEPGTMLEEPAPATTASSPGEAAQPSAVYTCPMHPEVRESQPGQCPKCGMALMAETAPAATDASEEPAATTATPAPKASY